MEWPLRWVSPFGDVRIKGCSRLPGPYRSVPRPSSPLNAKASVRSPYALDRSQQNPCTTGLGTCGMRLYSQTFDVFFKVRPKTSTIPKGR